MMLRNITKSYLQKFPNGYSYVIRESLIKYTT